MSPPAVDDQDIDVEAWTPQERRSVERVPAELRVAVRREPGLRPVTARVVDVGEHGIGLRAHGRFRAGERVELDLEAEVPLRVHLGFDLEALVIDGPLRAHTMAVHGTITRCRPHGDRTWDVGVAFDLDGDRDACEQVRCFLEHLRGDGWL